MNPTRRTNIVATSLPDIRDGKAPAPYCEAAPPRVCSSCGVLAVLPLDAEARLAQPDATTHVCHPILGGCNQGFTVYATAESLPDGGVRLPLTPETCSTCGQPSIGEADSHGGLILVAPMVLEGSRSWSCDKQGSITLDGKPITREALAALLADAQPPRSLKERAARLAEQTADAYSADAYTSWRACAMLLLKRGYSEREAEAILRSKVTRWAGDASNKRYGQITARDLAAYLDKHVTPAFVAELVAGTFGGVS